MYILYMAFLGTITTSYRAGRSADRPKRTRKPLLLAAAELIGKTAARLTIGLDALRRMALSLAGFALIDTAAWEWNHKAGLAAAGLSLLVLEALTGGD